MQIIPPTYSKFKNPLDAPQFYLNYLSTQVNGITLYYAGLPKYKYIFTRDSLISGILMEDYVILRDQLVFNSLLQGTKNDPLTGEEPGKIFHQMPGKIKGGLSTEFNACDTTALFIHAHKVYLDLTGDFDFIEKQKKYIEKAVNYILKHLVNYLFVENPTYSDSVKYALKVTYWKDSQVTNRKHGIPAYPAVFTLAHVQNMRAIKSAAKVLNSHALFETSQQMKRHMTILYDEKRGYFYSGVDNHGFLPGISSDNLHILYYLDPDDITKERLARIAENMLHLETAYGFLTLDTTEDMLKKDLTKHTGYHSNSIWPYEQAIIHKGALKFGLTKVQKIAERIYPYLNNGFSELFKIEKGNLVAKGANPQLWTIAAKIYFDRYFSTSNVA